MRTIKPFTKLLTVQNNVEQSMAKAIPVVTVPTASAWLKFCLASTCSVLIVTSKEKSFANIEDVGLTED